MPIINIMMARGRTLAQKRELAAVIPRETARILEVEPEWVNLIIEEYPRENWASAGQLHIDKYGPGCGRQGSSDQD